MSHKTEAVSAVPANARKFTFAAAAFAVPLLAKAAASLKLHHVKLAATILSMTAAVGMAAQTNTFPLWEKGAPGARGTADSDIPTLTVYLPHTGNETGAAIVIFPGGGYGGLASHEGEQYARFLNEHGIAGFVLKYRLGSAGYRHPTMLRDAARAVRTVRARASEWNVNVKRVGIMGSSAGGHLASTLLTRFDQGNPHSPDPVDHESSRPDLGILCYPVITMSEFTHKGSQYNLLGPDPTPEALKEVSSELHVTSKTPPCFIWHTWEDKGVPVENAMLFASALRKAGVPFDLHIYEKGAHGLGLGTREWQPDQRHPWTRDLIYWLQGRGFASPK
jgi:acetyl esterase/lipase